MNFYNTTKWKHKRERILKRDEYLCQECKRYGKTTGATTVHHIYPLEQRLELALASINLISLCNVHHNEMHDRVTNDLTAKGLQWVDRIKNKVSPPPKD